MAAMSKQALVRLTSRRIFAPAASICLALALCLLVIMADAGAVPVATALLLAVGLVTLTATGMIGLTVERMRRRMDRELAEQRRLLDRADKVITVLGQTRVEVADVRVAGVELDKRLKAGLKAVRRELKEASDQGFRQIEALDDLRTLLRPRAPLPASRGFAASPDVIHLLVDHVWRHRPELVVECGSGTSTVWLGYAVERAGRGRVVALEHDERYADATRELVVAHGLDKVVEVRLAPLERWAPESGGRTLQWYARAAFADLDGIGVLFVDGPPGYSAPTARYPALPLLLERCAADPLIVLDDAYRADERTLSDRWLAEFPGFVRTEYQHEKGTHVFRADPGYRVDPGGRSASPVGCR